MLGLKLILELHQVQQKDLADELGIKKQNITLWLSGRQNISKKISSNFIGKIWTARRMFYKAAYER